MNGELYSYLVEAAKRQQTTTYNEVAALTDSFPNCPVLGEWLAEISRSEHAEGRPLLSVLVVSKQSGIPHKRFFKLARTLGSYDGIDEPSFLRDETARVFEYWR